MGFSKKIQSSRMLLQNPYAHIEEIEGVGERGLSVHVSSSYENKFQRYYGEDEIEARAISLQRALWVRRGDYGFSYNSNPVDILSPEVAASFLGYDYSLSSSLGWFLGGKSKTIVAGIIDRRKKKIEISTEMDPRVARFTAAHEIGHAILHAHKNELHRDKPISGVSQIRNRIEYEADKFAAFFLMPEKHLREEFSWRFIVPFKLQEETAFALLGSPYHVARETLVTLRDMSRALAGSNQFNGRRFTSLADYFGVSLETMAIRLEELSLIDFED